MEAKTGREGCLPLALPVRWGGKDMDMDKELLLWVLAGVVSA